MDPRQGACATILWCHVCQRQVLRAVLNESHEWKCQICHQTGFVEELSNEPETVSPNTGPLTNLFGRPLEILFASDTPLISTSWTISENGRPESPEIFSLVMGALQNSTGTHMVLPRLIAAVVENNPDQYGSARVAQSTIDALPRLTLDAEKATAHSPCSICREDFIADCEAMRVTMDDAVCSHHFHETCLVPWLQRSNTCPVCRTPLPPEDPQYPARAAQLEQDIVYELGRAAQTLRVGTWPFGGGLSRSFFASSGGRRIPCPERSRALSSEERSEASRGNSRREGAPQTFHMAYTTRENRPSPNNNLCRHQ